MTGCWASNGFILDALPAVTGTRQQSPCCPGDISHLHEAGTCSRLLHRIIFWPAALWHPAGCADFITKITMLLELRAHCSGSVHDPDS